MRNLIYFKINRDNGQISFCQKIVSRDLECRVSWGQKSSSKPLSILEGQDALRVVFDEFNSLPLFWGEAPDGDIIVSNRFDKVAQEIMASAIDPVGFWELYLFETPLLSRTLFKEVSVSQSGHELVFDEKGCRLERYFDFSYGKQKFSEDVVEKSHNLLTCKLNQSVKNAVFPISGGMDSRLVLSYMQEGLSGQTQFITYGFSSKIFENCYAKQILQILYGSDYLHDFHMVDSQGYICAGMTGAYLTGGLAGIQNSHLLSYAQKTQLIGIPCILGMFADAIFGYGVSKHATDWQTCSYAKKVKSFQLKEILTIDVAEQILADLELLYNDWMGVSDISSFDEYLYVRERNGKFHTLLMSALQDYWDVNAPLNDPEIVRFFMSLPNEIRKDKAILSELLQKFFPNLSNVGNVSSSFRHSNDRIFHKCSTLLNNILSRKLGLLPIVPIYTDTERHDYSFIKYYKAEYREAIDQVSDVLALSQRQVDLLSKIRSGMHGFQFISNAKVINSILVADNE